MTVHSFSVFSALFDIVWVLLVDYLWVYCVSGFLSFFLFDRFLVLVKRMLVFIWGSAVIAFEV